MLEMCWTHIIVCDRCNGPEISASFLLTIDGASSKEIGVCESLCPPTKIHLPVSLKVNDNYM